MNTAKICERFVNCSPKQDTYSRKGVRPPMRVSTKERDCSPRSLESCESEAGRRLHRQYNQEYGPSYFPTTNESKSPMMTGSLLSWHTYSQPLACRLQSLFL